MKPVRIIPRSGQNAADIEPMLRDHHALLNGGMKIADQMAGETKLATFNRSYPPTLSSKLTKPPAQIVCLSAKRTDGTGPSMSGMPVHWTWGGTATSPSVVINDIVGLTDATDYSVSLWLSEG